MDCQHLRLSPNHRTKLTLRDSSSNSQTYRWPWRSGWPPGCCGDQAAKPLPPPPTSWLLIAEPAALPTRATMQKRKRRTRDRSETGRNAGSVSYPIQVRGRAPILSPPTAPRADLTAAHRGVWGFRPPVSLTGSAPDHLWVASEVSPTRLLPRSSTLRSRFRAFAIFRLPGAHTDAAAGTG